jgi:hypothetical protein
LYTEEEELCTEEGELFIEDEELSIEGESSEEEELLPDREPESLDTLSEVLLMYKESSDKPWK